MFKSNQTKYLILISAIFLISALFLNFAAAKFDMETGVSDIQTKIGIKVTGPESVEGIVNIIISILNWTYSIFFVVAVLFIIFAAYEYLTGAEDPEKISGAHKRLIWAAVAIAVALLALSVNLLVKNFIGASAGSGGEGAAGTTVGGS